MTQTPAGMPGDLGADESRPTARPTSADVPAPAAAPPPLSTWLRALWVGSVAGVVVGMLVVGNAFTRSQVAMLEGGGSAPAAYLALGDALVQTAVLGLLVSAVLTWWERRDARLR